MARERSDRMLGRSHELCTKKAFELLISMGPESDSPEISREFVDGTVRWSREVDELDDVELVNVRGLIKKEGQDDPHRKELGAFDDTSSYGGFGHHYTAFNHFIDIKKGPGIFDDYDGYSYQRGSASRDQHEDALESQGGLARELYHLLGENPKIKVDELINWYLGDNYVHVLGREWCDGCSPAMANYSFFADRGAYSSVEELKARFPVAGASSSNGMGVPYSVFMPVDNLARYHHDRFLHTQDALSLGAVMHAIQDVAVPHHAAGYLGNFHARYEAELDASLPMWLSDAEFLDHIKELFHSYRRIDSNPPSALSLGDEIRIPGRNWRVDMLVTWLALWSYRSYETTYGEFCNGYSFDSRDAKGLVARSIALCMVALESLIVRW